jgi:hypothetical protein
MSLDSSEQLASKAREMFHKCLNRSIPTGNLYSGGLGAYYLLLEQSRYHGLVSQRQQMQMLSRGSNSNNININNNNHSNTKHSNHNHSTPFRCKRLLKQALEGAKTATNRFKRSNSYQRSNISLLGGEWVGSHALLAVCYRRLEDFSKRQKEQQQPPSSGDGQSDTASSISSPVTTTSGRNGAAASSGASLFSNSKRAALKQTPSSSGTVASGGGASMRSMRSTRSIGASTVATTNPRPRSEQVADKILYRLEKQHLASDEDYDDLTYSTFGSNYTNNTLSSMAIAAVWNQDVLGGRAGALQAIWWLRKEFNDGSLGQDLVVSLAAKILEEGHSTAASMGFHRKEPLTEGQNQNDCYGDDGNGDCYGGNDSDCYDDSDGESESGELLFWVCDSQGSHKAYLGAGRGVVGILHTLLGLSHGDWELVEEQIPNARVCVRHTINVFLPTSTNASTNASVSSEENLSSNDEDPSGQVTTSKQQREGESAAETRRRSSLHERFLYSHPSPPDAEITQPKSPTSGNLRPRLDASQESDTTVDWFHGATGLAMLFLQASKVFRSNE